MNNYSEIVSASMTALLETIMIFEILATATEFKFTATSFLIEHPLLGPSTKYEILVTVVELNLQIFKYCVRCLHAFKVNFTLQKMKLGCVLNAYEFKNTKTSSGAR